MVIRTHWNNADWQEAWLLYALGCQDQQGRYAELFREIIETIGTTSDDTCWRSS